MKVKTLAETKCMHWMIVYTYGKVNLNTKLNYSCYVHMIFSALQ